MKIKFGAIVTDGRNKIGGHVASKNKGGNYLKTKSTPTNPQTAAQSAVRSAFGALAQSWRGLTAAQRASWNSGASNFPYTDIFGDSKVLSGFGLFMQLNGNLNAVGATLLTTCPSPASVDSITSLTFENDGGSFSLASVPTAVPAGYAGVLLGTAGLSAGRAFAKSENRQIGVVAETVGLVTNYQDSYTAVFGTTGDGSTNIYASAFLVNLSTGQVSQMVTALGLPA